MEHWSLRTKIGRGNGRHALCVNHAHSPSVGSVHDYDGTSRNVPRFSSCGEALHSGVTPLSGVLGPCQDFENWEEGFLCV